MNFSKFLMCFMAAPLLLAAVSCSTEPVQDPIGGATQATDSESAKAAQVVRRTISLAQDGRTDEAIKNVGVEEISRFLLGGEYDSVSSAQQEKFNALIKDFVALKALPQAMKLLQNKDPDSIQFQAARRNGDRVFLPSSLPGSNLSVTWILQKRGRNLVITDFLDPGGESSMERSRDKQIQPLYRKKGMEGLLATLEGAIAKMR